jgi:hypothetical protein
LAFKPNEFQQSFQGSSGECIPKNTLIARVSAIPLGGNMDSAYLRV